MKHRPNGRCWVTLAIRRCSWTRRPTTTINATDLRCRKFSLVPVRPVTLKGAWNERLNATMNFAGPAHLYPMKCCEAVGVP